MIHYGRLTQQCVPDVAHEVGEGEGAVEGVGDLLGGLVVEGDGVGVVEDDAGEDDEVAEACLLELGDDVFSHKQSGSGDGVAEALVGDGLDVEGVVG